MTTSAVDIGRKSKLQAILGILTYSVNKYSFRRAIHRGHQVRMKLVSYKFHQNNFLLINTEEKFEFLTVVKMTIMLFWV
jgi:hypothetical protein